MKETIRDIRDICDREHARVHVVIRFSSQEKVGYTCDREQCPINGAPDCPFYQSYPRPSES